VSASTVGDYTNAGCSTAVVLGLSTQIVEQVNCDHPNTYVAFTAGEGINFASSAVLPDLDKSAADDLVKVGATDAMTVTSGLLSLAQQYLLDSWAAQSMCGITADAPVGSSSHEAGRAVDLSAPSTALITVMATNGWAHDVPNAPMHFDHTASAANQGYDVHAFQMLWNENNPSDQIPTDGVYSAQVEARLIATPATGFAMGATCNVAPPPPPDMHDAKLVSVAGPERALPEISVHYAIVLKNTGGVDWPASTQLTLASGATSPLHDASWTSDTVVTTVGKAVPVGAMVTVAFNVKTPAADADTPVAQTFALDDAGAQFGMIPLALTVGPSTSDPGGGDSGGAKHAGCAAGGGASPLVLLALFAIRRRRPL